MKHVQLVATDMDHTLLTEAGQLPPGFHDCVRNLRELGVDVAIASGRPLYTLKKLFPDLADELIFISDNGGAITHRGELLYKSLMNPEKCREMIRFVEEKTTGIAVLCGLDCAYINRAYQSHEDFLRIFLTEITFVDDLSAVTCDANKFTVFFPNKDSKIHYETIFNPQFGEEYSVTVGDSIWIDMMNKGVDKGEAMNFLAQSRGIDARHMMAFGDTYNDKEMLQAVHFSYLMANAAEDMRQYANYSAKSNDEYGVIHVLEELIRQKQA